MSTQGHDPQEMESQFLLRLPPQYAATVRQAVHSGSGSLKGRLTIEFHDDGRHGTVRVDSVRLAAKVVDLPCIIESAKTVDQKTFYKTADICQMLVCSEDGDPRPAPQEPAAPGDPGARKKPEKKDASFTWNHGVTLPLKNVRKTRFRKTVRKKCTDSPQVEDEVKRLLREDAEAVSAQWEFIPDEAKKAEDQASLAGSDCASPEMGGQALEEGSPKFRELLELFNSISSGGSSEEEDLE